MAMNLGTGNQDEPEVMMDINTTPLIDVMLVLLIMLIITIPAQLHSVNLDMPVPTPQKVDPVVVKIEIDADASMRWNGQVLADRQALQDRLAEAAATQPQPELHIRSHAKAKYEATAAVLASAQRAGLTKLGIVGSERFAN